MSHGCYNEPRIAGTYPGQYGWTYSADGKTRTPIIKQIENVMTIPCQFSKHRDISACHACDHSQQGRLQLPAGE